MFVDLNEALLKFSLMSGFLLFQHLPKPTKGRRETAAVIMAVKERSRNVLDLLIRGYINYARCRILCFIWCMCMGEGCACLFVFLSVSLSLCIFVCVSLCACKIHHDLFRRWIRYRQSVLSQNDRSLFLAVASHHLHTPLIDKSPWHNPQPSPGICTQSLLGRQGAPESSSGPLGRTC